jgi:hypothetical protein
MSELKVNKISPRSGTDVTLGDSGDTFIIPSGATLDSQGTEIKTNKISPSSSTTLTLGDSGDTITIPSGATISNNGTATGFGATGAVNWDTTAKTTGFTAVSGVGYFCDTTSAGFTVTLPATPSAGDIVGLVDYAGTFDTNALTIDPNGEDIEGGTVIYNLLVKEKVLY